MEILPIFKIVKTELTEQNKLVRQTEPEAIMNGQQQTLEYNLGADIDGPLLPIYLFHLPRIARLLKAGDHVLELGCGTAHILCMLASLCPDVQFTGLDMSGPMLEHAEANRIKFELQQGRPIKNLQFIQGSMTDLSNLSQKFDAVISNFAFHHLQSLDDVKGTLTQIQKVTNAGAAIYISDFIRPKSMQTIKMLSEYSYKNDQSVLNEDYKYSLMASFSEEEIKEALASITTVQVQFSKIKIFALLFFVKTKSKVGAKPPAAVRDFVKRTLRQMPAKNRRDYWALRLFSFDS